MLLDSIQYHLTTSDVDHIEMSDDYMAILLTYEGAKTAMLDYELCIEVERETTDIHDGRGRVVRTITNSMNYYINDVLIARVPNTNQFFSVICKDGTVYTLYNDYYYDNMQFQQQEVDIALSEWLKIINL